MLKTFAKVALAASAALMSQSGAAQDLLAGKPIFPLGEAKTWSNGDASYTFITEDLSKLVATPQNTSNVYLYPENGAINTEENQRKGAQSFYVDMEAVNDVAYVMTTWEGAAASSFNIYLTDSEPTTDILSTTPTYSATNLGQYTENTAVLPEGSRGRYLVFQPVDATNWGWGIKIRSIAATGPVDDVLTAFTLSTAFVQLATPTDVAMTFKNQNGLDIAADKVTVTVSDNATYAEGKLTITTGESALFTATMGDVALTATVYAMVAPALPDEVAIMAPIFTNTKTEFNGTAGFIVAYNGGAKELGRVSFADGTVAAAFADTCCVFFYNNSPEIMGGWNVEINPTEKNYGALYIDIFGTKDVTGNVVFERTTAIGDNHPFTLKAGEWTTVEVPLVGETMLYTMSVRFDDANVSDILLSNIYFSAMVDNDDTEAPVLGEITALSAMTGVTLSFSATDAAKTIYYTINDGSKNYVLNAPSGETVEQAISGLTPDTEYTFTITASDGKNKSSKTIVAKTNPLSIPSAPAPAHTRDKMRAIFCPAYGVTPEQVRFDNWGSAARGEKIKDAENNELFYLSNYGNGQWGGIVDFQLAIGAATTFHIDIYGDFVQGEIVIYPVWLDEVAPQAEGVHIAKTIEPDRWNSIDIPMADFGYEVNCGKPVFQVALTNSTLNNFAVNNLYFWSDEVITGVEAVEAEREGKVDVYTLQGVKVRGGVEAADALEGLPGGLYIVGGRKVAK